MIYTIWIVTPVNYTHSRCFEEMAKSLCEAFKEIGHECRVVTSSFECKGKVIALGANLFQYIHLKDIPQDMIIWNLEQIFKDSPWLTSDYIKTLKKYEVWDYCRSNIEELKKMGIQARLLEVGYMPCLTVIENHPEPNIDVLFIGSMNDRRMKIIQALSDLGVVVHHAFDCYGVKRDTLIARAKIVLNVHFYESKLFEIVRCSYLMANRKCIVSEEPEEDYGICFVPYNNIVDRCIDLLKSEGWRELGQKGFESFSKRSQVEYLKVVL